MRRTCPILFVFLLVGACRSVPPLRIPQVEHATEAVQSGGDRYRAHRACSNAARSVDRLIDCMHEAGWDFLARGPGYPESECWQARDAAELEHITEICFARHVEQRPATGP